MMRLHTRMNLENFPRKRARTYLSQTIHRGHLTVTLKSTSRVTQGHWKRNHWTDHTRLTIRRVIGREYYRALKCGSEVTQGH